MFYIELLHNFVIPNYMNHETELKKLFTENTSALTTISKSNELYNRMITFDSFKEVINMKMAEAYESGVSSGIKSTRHSLMEL